MADDTDNVPLFKGTLDLLILKALTWGPLHGYGISLWLDQRADGAFKVDDSAMYQALQRLEGRSLLSAGWGTTENNRRARYYKLTTTGQQRLRADMATWRRYTQSVSGILALAERGA
jgi:PadR family transcriptional regulator PadR